MATVFISPSTWGHGGPSAAQWGTRFMSWGGYFINAHDLGLLGDIKFVLAPAEDIYFDNSPAGDIKYDDTPAVDIKEI